MVDTAHTPGPWAYGKEDGVRTVRTASGEAIMGDATYYPWCPSNEADWPLIAASPELLEALRYAAQAYSKAVTAYQFSPNSYSAEAMAFCLNARDRAVVAIAKAEGRS